jgi:uncharacterized protein (UPF0264 family)
MKLLVSVASAEEARAAVEGGADIIDAKDPSAGALGAVALDVFGDIRSIVGARRMVTAALGDAGDDASIVRLAEDLVRLGATLVKVGFAGVADDARVEAIVAGVARACASMDAESGCVAVAYADAPPDESIDAMRLVSVAARAGARGVLVDTRAKTGPGLTSLWSADRLAGWVTAVRGHGLTAAVAGRLSLDDLTLVRDAGADIAGVRGAACVGGREGRVSAERVSALVRRCHDGSSAARSAPVSSAWTIDHASSGGSARAK